MLSSLLWPAFLASAAAAQSAGQIVEAGDTQISAMMMFLGNTEKVYMLDKAEGNAAQINGHPAWGSVWDIASKNATVMDVITNTFCSSGFHLPNGSYATFGGNGAVGVGGKLGSQAESPYQSIWDATYQDYDGTKAIRILNPCDNTQDMSSPNCQWFDNSSLLAMQNQRWYSTAEALPDGSIVLIGGFVNGGYVNRNFPNTDPTEGGAADLTYEFYPANGRAPQTMQFMIKTSGLNAYAHAYLMPSGNMFVQANLSTILWNYTTNVETPLPNMPNNVVRVYPASGATAMLPLTPANNWTPTILFCGGQSMAADDYGSYLYPNVETWNIPASQDCQRITPEPTDGSQPAYVQDDNMIQPRTMGQFISLPDGTLLMVNGGLNGTAGYGPNLANLTPAQMPFGQSFATGPVGTPAIYNPNAPVGSRWTQAGLGSSNIARLYHSSAILLPDASVLIAGSNPNLDVNLTTIYPTTYKAEIFYPPYFSSTNRPVPAGIPNNISYGGNPFNITVPASSYSGSANAAAANTTVVLSRAGFTTHSMNMGQRHLELNNTYTVNSDGSVTLHVAQAPPNPAILTPGPALLFVVISGIPSNGTMVIVGNGQMETQPTSAASTLPANVQLASASGTGSGSGNGNGSGSGSSHTTTKTTSHTAAIVGGIVGAVAIIGILGAVVGICLARRRRSMQNQAPAYPMRSTGPGAATGVGAGAYGAYGAAGLSRGSEDTAFVPLQDNSSQAWVGGKQTPQSLNSPYTDHSGSTPLVGAGESQDEFNPYYSQAGSRMASPSPHMQQEPRGYGQAAPRY